MMRQFEQSEKFPMFPIPRHGKHSTTLKIKEKSYKTKTMGSNEKESPKKKINQSELMEELEMEDSETDIMNLLKMEALKDSIEAYEGILKRIERFVNESEGVGLSEMKKHIADIIYMKK